MSNSVNPDQTAPIGIIGINSSVMLASYLQQTPSTDDIFRCIFLLAL